MVREESRRAATGWRRIPGRRIIGVLATGMTAVVMATACSGTGAQTDGQKSPTRLSVGFTQEPADWNYLRNASTAIRSLLFYNVVETLIEKQEDGSFAPLLAESYQASSNGSSYTFHLRDANFHNGQKVTVDSVIYSLNLAKQSGLAEVSAPFGDVKSLKKIDDATLEIALSKPSQAFLEALAKSVPIIPVGSEKSLAKKPVGSGPFVFEDWQTGVRVDLNANDDYWGTKPAFDEVLWRFIPEPTAALNALLAGDIDVLPAVMQKEAVRKAKATPGFSVTPMAGSEIFYVSLNAKNQKLRDPRVRQAIAHGIDRNLFAQGIKAVATPTCVMVNPPTEPWKSGHCPYPHNPDRARQLLNDAGGQGLTLRFPYIVEGYSEATEILTQQLKDVGVVLEPDTMDLATYIDRVLTQADYEATVISGPQQIDNWQCPGFFTQDCSREFDEQLVRADAKTDRAEWAELRRKAVNFHADRAYLIPLATVDQNTLHRAELAGFKGFAAGSEFDLRQIHWATP